MSYMIPNFTPPYLKVKHAHASCSLWLYQLEFFFHGGWQMHKNYPKNFYFKLSLVMKSTREYNRTSPEDGRFETMFGSHEVDIRLVVP